MKLLKNINETNMVNIIRNRWIFIFITILLLFSVNTTNSQSWRYYTRLNLIQTDNKQVDSILLETIRHVEKCEYYTKDLAFRIDYFVMFDTCYMGIQVSHFRQELFCPTGLSKIFGYYKVKKHLVVVFCDEKQNLFLKTKSKKKFLVNNSDKVKLLINSDYFFWMFIIKGNKFYLKDKLNNCDNVVN